MKFRFWGRTENFNVDGHAGLVSFLSRFYGTPISNSQLTIEHLSALVCYEGWTSIMLVSLDGKNIGFSEKPDDEDDKERIWRLLVQAASSS